MKTLHYIYILFTIIIFIYFFCISNNNNHFLSLIVDFIHILPLPKLVKDVIYLLFYKIKKSKKYEDVVPITKTPSVIPMIRKRNVTPLIKKIIASNQKWTCLHCKNLLDYTYEIDHIVPLFKGGLNDISNLQALCRNCHGKKTILGY